MVMYTQVCRRIRLGSTAVSLFKKSFNNEPITRVFTLYTLTSVCKDALYSINFPCYLQGEFFPTIKKKLLEFAIIFFVMTFRFDSGVILLGENEMPISLRG